MASAVDRRLTRLLVATVDVAQRRAWTVLLITLLSTIGLGVYAAGHLGVDTDGKGLLAQDLPFQRAAAEFRRHFPSLDDSLLVVVDAKTPDAARDAAAALAAALRKRPEVVRDVFAPGTTAFFERTALLYRTPDELQDFTDHLAKVQPVIAELSRDPHLGNLTRLVQAGLENEQARGTDPAQWAAVLDRVREATTHVYDEYPLAVSWEQVMLEGSAFDEGSRQVLVVEPVLDFTTVLAAERPVAAIRGAAADLGLDQANGVRVRITGNPALNYEEMLGLMADVQFSTMLSLGLVIGIAVMALRSFRLVLAAAVTLITGLVWTTAFAAAAVGRMNIVSIAFAVLFVGIGIDFAIHLGMHFVDAARAGRHRASALRASMHEEGVALVLCAGSTSIGFWAFVPTEYRGVAELGLIAGTGMVVVLLQTVTLFPALIAVLLPDDPGPKLRPPLRFRLVPPAAVVRHPVAVLLVTGAIAAGAAYLAAGVRFDANVLAMRDPSTESVQTFRDLLSTTRTSPWAVDVLTPDLASARALATKLRALPTVAEVRTLDDWVPSDQAEKRDILADAAMLMETPPGKPSSAPPVAEQIAALRRLHDALDRSDGHGDAGLGRAVQALQHALDRFLARVEAEPDPGPALASLERLLLGNFPEQIQRLRKALEPPTVAVDDIPPDLRSRFLDAGGAARVQVFPRENLDDAAALARFVDAVRALAPDGTGVAVNILEFGRATVRSLVLALGLAVAAIALLVFAMWRRVRETLLVMVPLLLCGLLTVGAMPFLGLSFDFCNVIVLPMLLGMGVDSGIHLVSLARTGVHDEARLLDSTTGRAVFFSAATTILADGSIAFAAHRGLAGMGVLLVVGLLLMLVCQLVFLPALIAVTASPATRRRHLRAA